MSSNGSPTKAAYAVSQALGEIGLPPARKPAPSALLTIGRSAPKQFSNHTTTDPSQRIRPPPFPGAYGRPWKTALNNQLNHSKKETVHPANIDQTQTVITVHDDPVLRDATKTEHRPARSPFRLLRANEVFQSHLQRPSQGDKNRQPHHRAKSDSAGNPNDQSNAAMNVPRTSTSKEAADIDATIAETIAEIRVEDTPPLAAEVGSPLPTEPPVLPLVRRTQNHHRNQSSPPLPQRKNAPTGLSPTKQSQTLFFHTPRDRDSSMESCSVAELSSNTPSIVVDQEPDQKSDKHPIRECSDSNRKSPERIRRRESYRKPSEDDRDSNDSFKETGARERIGKLSRQEDEFDFAILLKPSKYEEHVDLPDAAGTARSMGTLKTVLKTDAASVRTVIVARIQKTGLHVKRLLSLDGKQSLLKVRAPQRVLELGAERLRLRKQRQFDRVWMVFSCELRSSFADFDPVRKCINFLDSEKQSIVHTLLTAPENEGGAGLNESCPIATRYVVQMYPLHKQDLDLLKERWVTFWRSSPPSDTKFVDVKSPARSPSSNCLALRNILHQPLDDVAQYFGERVAFYFAWMEMYTRWLVVPSVAGVILFGLQVHSHHLDHPAAPIYALFMAVWTSAFIIAWRRRAAALAYRWGTWGYEDEEVTRPEFYGDGSRATTDIVENDNQKPVERHYAMWKRLLKYSVTMPCVAGSIVAVVTLSYFAFSTRDRLEAESLATKHEAALIAKRVTKMGTITIDDLRQLAQLGVRWDFWVYLLLTPILYGLLIPFLDAAFTRTARSLNNWENHRTESRYQSHLILKVFSFRFVHVFASLYYYAFAPQSSSTTTEGSASGDEDVSAEKADGMVRVAIQLASFMVAGQLWKNVMETLYPFVRRRLDARAKKRATNQQFNQSAVFNGLAVAASGPRGPNLHRGSAPMATTMLASEAIMSSNAVIHEQCVRLEQASDRAWEEAGLQQYDTFEDYTEMLVQFGYVSFFSLAFPLAPLLALLNNLLELRTDAFKLCRAKQRPLAHKASGIGVWLHVLQIMSVIAVLTNCFHLAYSTSLLERAFPSVTPTQKVWIVFGIEHFLLLLKVWLACVIPTIPNDVAERLRREREHAKHDSARAMAVRMLAVAETTSTSIATSEGSPPKLNSLHRRRPESSST